MSWEEQDTVDKTNLLDRNITWIMEVNNGSYGISQVKGFIEVRLAYINPNIYNSYKMYIKRENSFCFIS